MREGLGVGIWRRTLWLAVHAPVTSTGPAGVYDSIRVPVPGQNEPRQKTP